MKGKRENIISIVVLFFIIFSVWDLGSSEVQSLSGTSGYTFLPATSTLERGEIMFSTWGSYISSREFSGAGIFPVSFATGFLRRAEAFLSFSGISGFTDFDRGMTAGLKLNLYNTNSLYPSAGVMIESYKLDTSPDVRILLLLEKQLPFSFRLLLSGGYAFGDGNITGATGTAGFLYGKGYPKVVLGAKADDNGRSFAFFISGLFRIIDKLYVNVMTGHTFSSLKSTFIASGITFSMLKEKKVSEIEVVAPPEVQKTPEKKVFDSPVPQFKLKLN